MPSVPKVQTPITNPIFAGNVQRNEEPEMKNLRRYLLVAMLTVGTAACGTSIVGPQEGPPDGDWPHNPDSGQHNPDSGQHNPDSGQ